MGKRIAYTFLLLSVLAACSREYPSTDDEYRTIRMRAQVSGIVAETKADSPVAAVPWRGTTPNDESKLKVKLLLSLKSGIYEPTPTSTNFLPCHTWIEYDDNQFHDPATVTYTPPGGDPVEGSPKYPTSRDMNNVIDKVYCTGLYPEDGWTVPDAGTTAVHVITGAQDLMYAPEIQGSAESLFGPQTYQHLLTWIKVCICATSTDALDKWGNIEYVEIKGKDSITINLADGSATYGADNDFMVHNTVVPLTTTISSVGSIFCAPAKEFTVKLKSSNFADPKEIIIKRDPADDAAQFDPGKLYVLEIYFGTSSAEGICRLIPWDYQDESLNMK